jgi:SAM-dependent methyltransferase
VSSIERYDYAFDPKGDEWPARLLRRVPQDVSVLELGPGPGAMTRVLLQGGHEVTVVESDPAAAQDLRQLQVQVVQADLDTAQWRDALAGRCFGAVLACDVLEHLRQPRQVLAALAGMLEPSGCLVVSVPNVAYAGVLAGLRAGVFEYGDKGLLDRTHVHFFTRRSLEEMLMDCGWVPVAWEAHRVPLERSEFAHHGQALSGPWREYLLMGWPDFDVYQWMALAVPARESRQWQGEQWRGEARALREELRALQQRHALEHASLLEHQKAFGEAKELIARFEGELEVSRAKLSELQRQHDALLARPDRSWRARLRGLLR